MVHHIIKEIDQKDMCPYCGINFGKEDWNSEFHLEFHYKTLECKCGKKVRRKVDYMGSGHKKTGNKGEKSIDNVIREINEVEVVKKGE